MAGRAVNSPVRKGAANQPIAASRDPFVRLTPGKSRGAPCFLSPQLVSCTRPPRRSRAATLASRSAFSARRAARSRADGTSSTTPSIMAVNRPNAAATQTANHFQPTQLIESRSSCPAPTASPEAACNALIAGFIASTMDERALSETRSNTSCRALSTAIRVAFSITAAEASPACRMACTASPAWRMVVFSSPKVASWSPAIFCCSWAVTISP